ncbi:MAG: hypothetical protein Q7R41_16880, partial [Phycisphaerales bacterium]|nr:hypothetical protein [Phycisphaerales bacterium]
MKHVGALALLLLGAPGAHAVDRGFARNAAAYLDVAAGARAIGMGRAQASVVPHDASALLANPAQLPLLSAHSLATNSGAMGENRTLHSVGYVLPFRLKYQGWSMGQQHMPLALGAGITSFKVGGIESRDEFGLKQDAFTNTENAYYFSFAIQSTSRFSFGATGKLLTHKIQTTQADGQAFDIGSWYRLPQTSYGQFDVSFLVRDFKGDLVWKVHDDNLNIDSEYTESVITKYVIAAAYAPNPKWRFAADFIQSRELNPLLHVGVEWEAYPRFFVRTGVSAYDPTFGFGYLLGLGSTNIAIDYAFQYGLDSPANT